MRVGGCLARVALVGVFLAGGAGAAGAVAVQGITVNTFADFSRVTIAISGPAKPIVVPFAAEPEAGRPDRLAIDFPSAELEIPGPSRIEIQDGRIRSIRFGRTPAGGVRIVLDLIRAARHRGLRHTHPPRIELDVLGEAVQEPPAAP
jgi:hypothetical protein